MQLTDNNIKRPLLTFFFDWMQTWIKRILQDVLLHDPDVFSCVLLSYRHS